MANLLDYMKWRGDLSLESDPFNEIDALILSRVSYIPFEKFGLRRDSYPLRIGYASEILLKTPDIEEQLLWDDDIHLLQAFTKSERFKDMILRDFVYLFDYETQLQFAAITIDVDRNTKYVSFRGTDDTLIGWKENFNMSFTWPVPSQTNAVTYLMRLCHDFSGDLILGGHSKGGNLAMFSAAFCGKIIQNQIIDVYNFDGPGFSDSVLCTPEYQRIRDRITTYVPQSSIVGFLMYHDEDYIIVKSTQKWDYLQHDVYSWNVVRNRLIRTDQVTDTSRIINHALKGWLEDLSISQREQVIDAVYSVIDSTDAETFSELDQNRLRSRIEIISSISKLDDDTWQSIKDTVSLLMKNVKKSIEQTKAARRRRKRKR